MGQGGSHEEIARLKTLSGKLSKGEVSQLEEVFQELCWKNNEGDSVIKQPTWLNRDMFAEKFGLPELVVEQMFEAFDRDKNGVIDLDEFLMGMALCLHGTIKDKCRLLFKIFNLNGDDGISREELTTVLTSALQSAEMVLSGAAGQEFRDRKPSQTGEALIVSVTVDKIVKDAFATCNLSGSGKLDVNEFARWIHKNPKLVDNIFVVQCPVPSSPKSQSVDFGSVGDTPFHVIHTPTTECDVSIAEVFHTDVKQVQSTSTTSQLAPNLTEELNASKPGSPTKPTLLEMAASSPKLKQKSLKDLFPSEKDDADVQSGGSENFFDTLNQQDTNSAQKLNVSFDTINPETLPQTLVQFQRLNSQSTGDLSKSDNNEANLSISLGGSEDDLNRVQPGKSSLNTIAASQSLHSIALSRDSLNDKAEEGGDVKSSRESVAEADKDTDADKLSLGEDNPLMMEAPLPSEGTEASSTSTEDTNTAPGKDAVSSQIAAPEQNTTPLVSASNREDANPSTSHIVGIDNVALDTSTSGTFGIDNAAFEGTSSPPPPANDSTNTWHPLQNNVSVLEGSTEESGIEQAIEDTPNSTQESLESGVEANEGDVSHDNGEFTAQLTPSKAPSTVPLAYLAELTKQDATKERKYSFWQPSTKTLQMLRVAESGREVDQSCLTFPSVLVEGTTPDPVKELVAKYLGEQEANKRPALTVDGVEFTDDGLRKLLESGCWRAAVEFTAKFLSAHGQGIATDATKAITTHTPKLLQMWFVRVALLVKLRMFSSAEAELNAFGDFDAPDLYYEFYPQLYPGRKGSMVPFSLRLLHAELPQHNGRQNVALDRLYSLQAKVKAVLKNLQQGLMEDGSRNDNISQEDIKESMDLWNSRNLKLMYSIGNCFLGMEEYHLAICIFQEIIKLEPYRKNALLSGIGRICLQFGDIRSGQKTFKLVEQEAEGDPKSLSMVTMNKGFLGLSQGNYEDSFSHFQSAIKLDPENLSACNNAAVCLLFLGRVKEACSMLETMVCRMPERGLNEDILFNLCTIYELETSRALQKKHKLLDLVSKHRGDGFNVQCLLLT